MSMQKMAALLVALTILIVPLGTAAVPKVITDCKSDDECTVVRASCIEPVAANRRYANDLQSEVNALSAATDCISNPGADIDVPTVHCLSGLCSLGETRTPVAPDPKCLDLPALSTTGDIELDRANSELRIPIATTQRRALSILAKSGSTARVSLPLITTIWNQAYSEAYRGITECYVGWGDLRLAALDAMKPFCAEVPLPQFVIDCYRSGCLNQISGEEMMWSFLVACGTQAEPLVPDIVRTLETTPSGQGYRGEMIAVLRNAPSQRKLSLPVLKKIAEAKTDFENIAALEALAALGEIELGDDSIVSILNDQDENPGRATAVVKLLPKTCVARDRCVQALIRTCESSSILLRYESVRALGRFGSDGLAGAEAILKLYFETTTSFSDEGVEYNSTSDSLAALRAIDPRGDNLLPLIRPHLESSFNVRKAVELLEQLSGEDAQRLARETRSRWNL